MRFSGTLTAPNRTLVHVEGEYPSGATPGWMWPKGSGTIVPDDTYTLTLDNGKRAQVTVTRVGHGAGMTPTAYFEWNGPPPA